MFIYQGVHIMPKKNIIGETFEEKVERGLIAFVVEPKVEGGEPNTIMFDLSKVTPSMLRMLALHGARQKIGDSYAGAKESGEDPVDYATAAILDTIKQLYAEEHG